MGSKYNSTSLSSTTIYCSRLTSPIETATYSISYLQIWLHKTPFSDSRLCSQIQISSSLSVRLLLLSISSSLFFLFHTTFLPHQLTPFRLPWPLVSLLPGISHHSPRPRTYYFRRQRHSGHCDVRAGNSPRYNASEHWVWRRNDH